MSSVCKDMSVMWRFSDDLNRHFAARIQQHQYHYQYPHHPHHHHHPMHLPHLHHNPHRSGSVSMFYNGISKEK